MLLFAKGIGSGYPFAGMATKDHMWDGLPPGTMGEEFSWSLGYFQNLALSHGMD